MEFLEDLSGLTNVDDDSVHAPNPMVVSDSFFDSWLPDLEDHDYLRSPFEILSPSFEPNNNNSGLDQVPAAIMDFDIDLDASMTDPETRGTIQDMSSPNWLETFLVVVHTY